MISDKNDLVMVSDKKTEPKRFPKNRINLNVSVTLVSKMG